MALGLSQEAVLRHVMECHELYTLGRNDQKSHLRAVETMTPGPNWMRPASDHEMEYACRIGDYHTAIHLAYCDHQQRSPRSHHAWIEQLDRRIMSIEEAHSPETNPFNETSLLLCKRQDLAWRVRTFENLVKEVGSSAAATIRGHHWARGPPSLSVRMWLLEAVEAACSYVRRGEGALPSISTADGYVRYTGLPSRAL